MPRRFSRSFDSRFFSPTHDWGRKHLVLCIYSIASSWRFFSSTFVYLIGAMSFSAQAYGALLCGELSNFMY